MDSDITGNITSDCQEMMQTQEMTEAHNVDCTCESCCKISQSNCQDNRSQCEDTEQPLERVTKMKDKLVPLLVNGAVILAVIGLSGSINRIHAIERIPIEISSIHSQVIPEISDIPEINDNKIINHNRSIIALNSAEIGAVISPIDTFDIASNHVIADIEIPQISRQIAQAIAG